MEDNKEISTKEGVYPAALPISSKQTYGEWDPLKDRPRKEVLVRGFSLPVTSPFGWRIVYKRYFTDLEKSVGKYPDLADKLAAEGKSLCPFEEVEETAQRQKEAYLSARSALGKENIAKTLIMIGHPRGKNGKVQKEKIAVQVLQEKAEPLTIAQISSLEGDLIANLRKIKDILFKGDLKIGSWESSKYFPIRDWLEDNEEIVREFYIAYIEAVLLGYVPDIQFDKSGTLDIGLLFSKNIGIVKRGEEKQRLVLFDFGDPRIDVLSPEARQRLRSLIEKKKKEGHLPIEYISCRKVDTTGGVKTEDSEESVRLADWYKKALEKELKSSTTNKSEARVFPRNYLRFLEKTLELLFLHREELTDERKIDERGYKEDWGEKNLAYDLFITAKAAGCSWELKMYATKIDISEMVFEVGGDLNHWITTKWETPGVYLPGGKDFKSEEKERKKIKGERGEKKLYDFIPSTVEVDLSSADVAREELETLVILFQGLAPTELRKILPDIEERLAVLYIMGRFKDSIKEFVPLSDSDFWGIRFLHEIIQKLRFSPSELEAFMERLEKQFITPDRETKALIKKLQESLTNFYRREA